MNNSAHLHFRVLGPPSISANGMPLPLGRLQHRALLYRLAAQQEPVTRDQLAFLFWPDVADSRARRNLTQLLSHVRRALPDTDLLLTSKEHVQLDPARVWSDAVAFVQLAQRGEATAWKRMAELYVGELLSGVSLADSPEYEAWLRGARYQFERQFLEMLDELVAYHQAAGDYPAAIVAAQRYLQIDELSEEMHRQVILAYAAQRDRRGVQRQYEHCVTVLARELGVEPLPETEAAYQASLTGEAQQARLTREEDALAVLPGLDVPLVGRADLIEALTRAFRRAQTGLGQVILLAGEAGIGKSRLLQEFIRTVQAQATVLVGTCQSQLQTMPYHPLVDALRPIVAEASSEMGSVWLREAARLFPELGASVARNQHDDDAAEARGRLFEALRRMVDGLAAGHPVVLCLDDLHWADATTLAWLIYQANQLRRSRLLVVGTYRIEEPNAVGPLLEVLVRQQVGQELVLTRLGLQEVTALLAHAGLGEETQLAATLWQRTGGNPFFALEVLRELLERGAHAIDDGDALPISEGIRVTVQRRLSQLQPVARQVLEAAAIWGRTFSFDTVRQIAGRSELEVADGLDELLGRQVVLDEGSAVRFQHDLIRSVVYAEMSGWRRKLLHGRVAHALADTEGVESGEVAYHFERSEQWEQAITHYQEAAEASKRIFAWVEAAQFAQRGLDLLHHLPDVPARVYQEILLETIRGESLVGTKGYAAPETTAAFARAHTLIQQIEIPPHLIPVVISLGTHYLLRGDIRKAYSLCEELMVMARQMGRADVLLAASFGLGATSYYHGRLADAVTHLEAGIALHATQETESLRSTYQWDLLISCLDHLAFAQWFLGHVDQARASSRTALARAEEWQNPWVLAMTLHLAGIVDLFCGEVESARALNERGLAIATEHDFPYQRALTMTLLGWVHAQDGRVETGIAEIRQGLAILAAIGVGLERPYYLTYLCDACRLGDEIETAGQVLDEAFALMRSGGDFAFEAELFRMRGELLQRQGATVAEIEHCYEQAIDVARQQHNRSLELRASISLSRLWQREGRQAPAYQLLANIYGQFVEGHDTADLREAQALLVMLEAEER